MKSDRNTKHELVEELESAYKKLNKLETLLKKRKYTERDITEHKREAEEANRMVTVVRDSNDAITIQDHDGKITAWNRGAEMMFGYSEQEALRMKIWQLAPTDKMAEQKDFNQRLFAGEKIPSYETQRLTKDGRLLDVWLTVTKLVDDAGKVIGIAATERDITKRKRAEQELVIANKELIFQNEEKEKRAAELVIANKELIFQNEEKEKRAAELLIANKELAFQNEEKEKRAVELVIANKELIFQNEERKRTEEKINQLAAIVQSSEDAIIGKSLDGIITSWNKGAEKIYRYTENEVVGKSISLIIPPGNEEELPKILDRIKSGEKLKHYETVRLGKDGRIIQVSVSVSPILDPEGKIIAASSISRDITEYKRTKEKIKNNEKHFRDLIESLPQLFWTCRVDGPCDYLSKQWVDYTGIPEEEQLGYRWLEQLHPDDRDRTVSEWMEKINTGESFDVEFRIRRNDAVYHWFKTRAVPMHDAEGNIIKWFGSNTDFEEIKKAEEVLRETNEYLENLFNYANAPIIVWDPSLVITRFNHAFENLSGYSAEEVTGKKIDVLFPKEQINSSLNLIKRAVSGERWETVEIEIQRKDGDRRIVLWNSANILDKDGKTVVATIAQGHDITERKRAEEETRRLLESSEHSRQTLLNILEDQKRAEEEVVKLNAELEQRVSQRTSQLESVNKELEAFSYSVSHDLRAPLRHVNGYAELLSEQCQKELPEKGLHYLEEIIDSIRQMGVLIDDLLKFSRSGRVEMRESTVDMKRIVEEVAERLRQDNPQRNIEWSIAQLPSVRCDNAMMHLVWENLLSNAVKFTRTRKMARIEIGVREENKEFVFFVRDNGVGFDMQYAQKLFGVFQRLHSTAEFEGTGVGLANVHRIILRHGGRAWAEAEQDKGATFYFSLPK
jgi:PAS domain S-box-containing protein